MKTTCVNQNQKFYLINSLGYFGFDRLNPAERTQDAKSIALAFLFKSAPLPEPLQEKKNGFSCLALISHPALRLYCNCISDYRIGFLFKVISSCDECQCVKEKLKLNSTSGYFI